MSMSMSSLSQPNHKKAHEFEPGPDIRIEGLCYALLRFASTFNSPHLGPVSASSFFYPGDGRGPV